MFWAPAGGWPTQARFWLEWGVGTVFVAAQPDCDGRVEISDWTARKREPAAGRLCPDLELPTQAKTGLEWATRHLAPGRF
jgi:hypothetical protein